MTAKLCNAWDFEMRQNQDYFEFVFFDKNSWICKWLIMLKSIDFWEWKKYLYFMPNPTKDLLENYDNEKLFNYLYEVCVEFASNNWFDWILVPTQDDKIVRYCTNIWWQFANMIKSSKITIDWVYDSIEFWTYVVLSKTNDSIFAYDWWTFVWKRTQ